jgi:choline dehydrogenase
LAARLCEDPARSVLLVEAGPDYQDFDTLPTELKFGYGTGTDITTTSHNWSFTGRAFPDGPELVVPRGRVTGGTSAINGQVFRRAIPEDFDAWAAAGNDGWSFDQVLPYFCKSERDLDFHDSYHGSSGPVPVSRIPMALWQPVHQAFFDACRSLGYPEDIDQNSPDATGVGGRPFNNVSGIRMSTSLCYLSPARRRDNLTIWADHTVRRIGVERGRARYVEFAGPHDPVFADEIVVCAGTIGSPRLLMLSGIGPDEQLSSLGIETVLDVPGVGRNLRDHPVAWLEYQAADTVENLDWGPRMPVDLRCTASGYGLRNDIQIIPRVLSTDGRQPAAGEPDLRIRLTAGIQLETSRGELRLRTADIETGPDLDFRFLTEEADRIRLREALRLCAEIVATGGLADLVRDREPVNISSAQLDDDAELDRWFCTNVGIEQHATSTCKMGPASDPEAVVDQSGAVHGIDGLRVVDASIMPDCVRANTHATVVMIAEYIADRIS